MLIKAVQKYTRQTPRKVRLVANQVKDMPLDQALRQLAVIEKKSTVVISKVIRQAIADAMHNHGYQFADLAIDTILVNEGPRYRRFRAVSRGRAHGVIKRTCHVSVILKTVDGAAAPAPKAEAKAEPKVEAKAEKPAAQPKKVVTKKTITKKD